MFIVSVVCWLISNGSRGKPDTVMFCVKLYASHENNQTRLGACTTNQVVHLGTRTYASGHFQLAIYQVVHLNLLPCTVGNAHILQPNSNSLN